jgi:hypothetical protein
MWAQYLWTFDATFLSEAIATTSEDSAAFVAAPKQAGFWEEPEYCNDDVDREGKLGIRTTRSPGKSHEPTTCGFR